MSGNDEKALFKTIEIGVKSIETGEEMGLSLDLKQFQMGIYSQGAGVRGSVDGKSLRRDIKERGFSLNQLSRNLAGLGRTPKVRMRNLN